MAVLNILIVGVGGQGNVVASEILASSLAATGFHVSVGETFGASQRGGSVSSHVRAATDASPAPLIPRGLVDVLIGFEPLEVVRALREHGRPATRVLLNPRPVYPIAVQTGDARYPDPADLLRTIERLAAEVRVIPATDLAREAGDLRAQNIAMVGATAGTGWLPLTDDVIEGVLAERFADELLALNRRAFRLGRDAARALAAAR